MSLTTLTTVSKHVSMRAGVLFNKHPMYLAPALLAIGALASLVLLWKSKSKSLESPATVISSLDDGLDPHKGLVQADRGVFSYGKTARKVAIIGVAALAVKFLGPKKGLVCTAGLGLALLLVSRLKPSSKVDQNITSEEKRRAKQLAEIIHIRKVVYELLGPLKDVCAILSPVDSGLYRRFSMDINESIQNCLDGDFPGPLYDISKYDYMDSEEALGFCKGYIQDLVSYIKSVNPEFVFNVPLDVDPSELKCESTSQKVTHLYKDVILKTDCIRIAMYVLLVDFIFLAKLTESVPKGPGSNYEKIMNSLTIMYTRGFSSGSR